MEMMKTHQKNTTGLQLRVLKAEEERENLKLKISRWTDKKNTDHRKNDQ